MQSIRRENVSIILWLFTGCFLIFTMVIVGGITRLTGSGLSMVDWNLFMGTIPPLNYQEWIEAFESGLVYEHYSGKERKSEISKLSTWSGYCHGFTSHLDAIVRAYFELTGK